MTRKCPVCGKEFESLHNRKYCSDGCRETMMGDYRKRWLAKRKNSTEVKLGVIRISKDMVKAPPECHGQTTCLECSRKRCVYG